jgi:hypothetical protein
VNCRRAQSIAPLASVIGAHLAEWESAHVEHAVYGTDVAGSIAAILDAFSRDALGTSITGALFHESSIGAVTGVQLDDGRRVVIKAHQPGRTLACLEEIARLEAHLASRGLFAPKIIAGPVPLGRGHAIVEDYVEGELADGHQPAIRSALAEGLYAIVEACRPLVDGSSLAIECLPASLWPTPHSKLFDFEATSRGAEWIDAIARSARVEVESAPEAGDLVIGHADWRVEHVRFKGGRPVVAFDWDSLQKRREASLVGAVAHAFCADWSRNETIAPAPTLEEARAFVAAYEGARRRPFERKERRLLAGSFAYACSYTARCGHALGHDEREVVGTFMHLLRSEGERLLTL